MDELNLAVKKHNQGKLQEAEIIYRKILAENPSNADAWHLLGLIAHQTQNYEQASILIKKAIQLNPNEGIFYGNLAMVYDSLELDSSFLYEKALQLNSSYEKAYLAHYNLGIFYKEKGNLNQSLSHYNQSIRINPDFYEARMNKSLILLLLGNYEQGFEEFEYRFKKENPVDTRIFSKPKWQGEPDKKVLVVCEQGFGDSIQFIRYLSLMKEKNCQIILECKKELIDLFKGLADIIIEQNLDKLPEDNYDCYIHLMSLPRIFNTTINSIPNKIPYLKANPELVKKFRQLIQGKFKVGICWAGNPEQENDKNRSTTFNQFKALLQPEISFFSLQKKRNEQIGITDLSSYMTDFSETAALIENLDLIISVDTAISHLAGSLNKPVWTLLSTSPDWRYLLDRNDNPWYPSMKLFRQKKKGDWSSLLQEVSQELKKYENAVLEPK